MQTRAVAILRVGRPRLFERRDGAVALAQLLAQLAEREPGRGIAGRQLERLHQQIGGGGEIALGREIARPFEAAVGEQMAGRQMDRQRLQNMTSRDGAGDSKAYVDRGRDHRGPVFGKHHALAKPAAGKSC